MAKLNLSYEPIFHFNHTSYSGDIMAMPSNIPLFSAKPSEVTVTVQYFRSEKEISYLRRGLRPVGKTGYKKLPLTSPLLKDFPTVGQVLSRLK